ncbi:uncharacterized protein BDR25DRAFT_359547 [Lindgomyces ingoldianus]|uniref:Uncharacterized protein n=1 Tax=Lindgomyces ingoldianus TaxID=673940 RepID=A0ACB6QKH0_9PLEO|nr:uncharacterized protein BDR25DRAFT_359547 [Lindgomyces ingoldianus]KAF2466641.1 hypothetical protein BDR25DRAFT_359547 [Lindgomyces ingoldianus]
MPARERALTKRNITGRWSATSLFPFNPEQRLQRHVRKLASTADYPSLNELPSKINLNFCSRSVVLGKAKIMSYDDLEEARAKCAAKDKATTDKSKGKRCRKRKPSTLEAELEAGLEAEEEVDTISSMPKDKV